ncbi:hypothetical protein D3C71_1894670 [compost metagenome]
MLWNIKAMISMIAFSSSDVATLLSDDDCCRAAMATGAMMCAAPYWVGPGTVSNQADSITEG